MMREYRDLQMDFADASLVAIAEEKGWKDVFTLDGAAGFDRRDPLAGVRR
jgi:predicted nucleic acid-binding protein